MESEYLRQAYRIAEAYSDDPHTKTGAILVSSDGRVIGTGANSLPIGVSPRDRLARPKKYSFIEHAERNAIFAACRLGECTKDATLYAPWFACAECARAIIQAGVKRVVGHKQMFDHAQEHWGDSISYGNEMLREAAIELLYHDAKLVASSTFSTESIGTHEGLPNDYRSVCSLGWPGSSWSVYLANARFSNLFARL